MKKSNEIPCEEIDPVETEKQVHTESGIIEIVGIQISHPEGEGVVDNSSLVWVVPVWESIGYSPEIEAEREQEEQEE